VFMANYIEMGAQDTTQDNRYSFLLSTFHPSWHYFFARAWFGLAVVIWELGAGWGSWDGRKGGEVVEMWW